ncbi:hypothetical protein [Antarcticirhabdus aurantiaca]|uniref:Uncharacterized protein n=1 Tax=Antarcticirhabdus aurantiaca TaxID=2606717 RepID=A0ACD4NWL0_9HYPH|nr:hypothetical protein [Antarcticirhabdus aurantiaca]WAJ31289.1 hypothetical protein OXU80_14255 [Jeongeuplla avenae]
MEFYAGPEKDLPPSNFRFLKATGAEGGERHNMQELEGRCYAYVPFNRQLKLTRIDPDASGAERVEGVTAVMTAAMPGGGTCIVGWYENATVHADGICRPNGGKTPCKVVAAAADSYIVPIEDRVVAYRRGERGMPGTAAVAYVSDINPALERSVLARINASKKRRLEPVTRSRPAERLKERIFQAAPELRMKVERAAVRLVGSYYSEPERYGSAAAPDPWTSVERENRGWDLVTTSGLRIEVKGRHARSFTAELTPNEYKAFIAAETDPAASATYRLAIVAGALDGDPDLAVFGYADGAWRCERSGRLLGYEERPGARVALAE